MSGLANEAGKSGGNLAILYAEKSGKGITHPFFNTILNAFKEEAESYGYDITFINNHCAEEEQGYLKRCRERQADGICLACVEFSSPEIKELVSSGIPCVAVDHIFKGVPAVLSDNETGVQKLVEYAISMGHRRIAFIHGHNNSIVTKTRISQFRNTMAYYKYEVPEEYVRAGLYDDITLTRKIVGEILRLPNPPTCILLPDDMTYLGAIEAARNLGLRIPDDISFAGYDGIALTQTLTPNLTTIHQSNVEIGRTAARKLIECIQNPASVSKRPSIFPVELIRGGTIAPPRQE